MKISLLKFREIIKEQASKLHKISQLQEEKSEIENELNTLNEKVNPWAVCHASTGPKKDEKFEKCVKDVKKKEDMDEAEKNIKK
jgi:hypothetical protein